MKPSPFAYAKAKSLDHAIELLARPDGEARLLAGGQSLIATLNMRLSAPKLLIDLNGIGGLAGIAVKADEVEIGALTRHAEAECSADIARHAPLIALAIRISAMRRSATAARSADRLLSPIPPPNCRRACWRSAVKLISPVRTAGARSRPTISSKACSRPRLARATC